MIIIFSSAMFGVDAQCDQISKILRERGVEHIVINPLSYKDVSSLELKCCAGEIKLYHKKTELHPDTIYFARNLRTDCLIDIPADVDLTTQYRHKIEAHILEIISVFRDKIVFPGKYEDIVLGEQKCFIYKEAKRVGLVVPNLTINSFKTQREAPYRKNLGFPFTITYSKKGQEEVSVTSFNRKIRKSRNYCLPWQWQIAIKPTKQIRCVVVGDTVWAYYANENQFGGQSLRQVHEKKSLRWTRMNLPSDIRIKLLELLKNIGLKYACPEFLLTKEGEYVFIDLNPCGDWYGFGSRGDNKEIISSIISQLCV